METNLNTSHISDNELKIGIRTELEHTNDIKIAKKIAMDHLKEDPNYYTKLAKVGLSHNNHSSNSASNENLPNNQPKNKVITLDIYEAKKKKKKKKKKPKPTDPKKWAAAKAWAKRTFDVYPSAYANAAAAKRYKKNGGGWRMSEEKINDSYDFVSTPSTYSDGYDKVSESKQFKIKTNTSIMKVKKINAVVKEILKEEYEKDSASNDDTMNVTQSDDMEQSLQNDADQESEQITITIDKDVAQKMHDLLMAALEKTSESDEDESEDESGENSEQDKGELKESKMVRIAKQLVKNRR